MPSPIVAIVGRPNVGKSTLFNRLVGRRQSIVHDQPGVTRDRIVADAELAGRGFTLIDTGGLILGEDELGLNSQVRLAIEEADALLMVVDGKDGLTAADEEVWNEVRRTGRPSILVINKSDTKAAVANAPEFARLGAAVSVEVSAEHALGIAGLVEELTSVVPSVDAEEDADEGIAVAVVGRPNVGKSSIVNRLIGEDRTLVSPVAGTTRDPVDTVLEVDGERYVLVDTAGIRRRSQVSDAPEALAVMMARRQIERCRVAVLVIDGNDGVTSSDLSIAGVVWELGRSAVVVVNKWDLVTGEVRERLDASYPRLTEILSDPERVNTSAVSGRGVEKIFPAIARAVENSSVRLSTSQTNRLFETALARHHAPAVKGRPWRVLYATQVKDSPPTFMLFANRVLPRSDPYRRYLENTVRRELGLRGVPVRLVIRRRDG